MGASLARVNDEQGVFRTEIVAAEADTDELGHVSNVAQVRFIQDVARAASSAHGWDLDAYKELGAFFVVRRHEIEYLRQAFAGETLQVTTWVSSWKGASSWRETRITRGEDLVVRARTLWALFDLSTQRPRRIPAGMKERFRVIDGEPA